MASEMRFKVKFGEQGASKEFSEGTASATVVVDSSVGCLGAARR